jgi:hypothetical protein
MNNSITSPESMTDLGRLLAGPQGEQNLELLTRSLNDEAFRVKATISAGLSADDYGRACRRADALQYAIVTLKSLRIFLTP